MNKIKNKLSVFLSLIAVFFLVFTPFVDPAFAKPRWWNPVAILGGTEGTLDSINGQNLFDGYIAIVITTTNTYSYVLDVDSAAAEDTTSFTVVSPDLNAGDKRWILKTVSYDFAFSTLADDATPTVANENRFLTGGTTTITDFDDGITGQIIHVVAEHSITITDGTNIFLDGSANFVMTATDTLTLIQKADGKWYELSRADSGA